MTDPVLGITPTGEGSWGPDAMSQAMEPGSGRFQGSSESPPAPQGESLSLALLTRAFRRMRKSTAPGIDGVTWQAYAHGLSDRLADLMVRVKEGRYEPMPLRRILIHDGRKERWIAVPTFEDRVLQRAVLEPLTNIFEPAFSSCSLGFRPGKGQHDALFRLERLLMRFQHGWVIDADIRNFFASIDQSFLLSLVRSKVSDAILLRLVESWIRSDSLQLPGESADLGIELGIGISPLLANIYLDAVLDHWLRRRWHGVELIRWADDFVIVTCSGSPSFTRRLLSSLEGRLRRFGLELHRTKTRLVQSGGQDSFDFLSFRHSWHGTDPGSPMLNRETAPERLSRACDQTMGRLVAAVAGGASLNEQYTLLLHEVRQHMAYFRLRGNGSACREFVENACRGWSRLGGWLPEQAALVKQLRRASRSLWKV
jgi:RNA-directed DNA polymerase